MNTIDQLEKSIEKHAQSVVELTQTLIRYPSVLKPPKGAEGECQKFVAKWMSDVFDKVDVFELPEVEGFLEHPAHWKYNDYEGRPDVVGTIKGHGKGRSLILTGHIDVVPEDPLPWKHNPFGGELEEGKIYGRGSYDMKGGLAAGLTAARVIRESGLKLAGDLIVESVVEEEYAGANGTLACVLRGYTADAAISLEPSRMEIATSTKSGRLYEVVTKGVAGMPFEGEETHENPLNPAYSIARMALAFEAFDKERNKEPYVDPFLGKLDYVQPASVVKIKVGQVEQGGLIGIPPSAWLHAWVFALPTTTEEELRKEVRGFLENWIAKDPELKANPPEINEHTRFLEGSVCPPDHPLVKTLIESMRIATGKPGKIGIGGSGDAGIMAHWGKTPTVILGPDGGRPHAADEYVIAEDLIKLVKAYAYAIVDWCGLN